MRRKIVVDTDAGIDDAQALLMLLHAERKGDLQLCAILTTHGNTAIHNVNKNVTRLLKLVNRLDVPVYEGCSSSLLGVRTTSAYYHGEDGFGDVPDEDDKVSPILQNKHAVLELVDLAKKHSGELELICLGPLTNLAASLKLDPQLGLKLRSCVVMGGNYVGRGNTDSNAEFNFSADPEAVSSVLNQLHCCVTLVTWEMSLNCPFTWEWYEKFVGVDSDVCRFMRKIEEKTIHDYYRNGDGNFIDGTSYITCDQLAAAVAIDKSLVKSSIRVKCSVDLHNELKRGQLLIDESESAVDKVNVEIITEVDLPRYDKLLMSIMQDM